MRDALICQEAILKLVLSRLEKSYPRSTVAELSQALHSWESKNKKSKYTRSAPSLNNLKKFEAIQMPGGVTLNGQKIYVVALGELRYLETEMESSYQEPPNFMMG